MADTKRDIVGRIQTVLREMEASAAFEATGRVVSGGGAFVTLTTANAASITTLIGAYGAAAP